ncbi:RHS repeat domain-containing protein [Breznakia pachnodae]|uniref:RHS repeat-associated protein n=1 Tax=Breznakia pachnodae TaxID=265178 RepID=A0ABU0E1D3_9FIRM|nr:RHS repeat-associated core domain-containing protein [Breznakia pachnodae]MDQ0360626.1 RHS repeat-associated protein [Breznakia pachnodae]
MKKDHNETFEMLREQVAKREANDNTCDVEVTAHKEGSYRKDPEITYYTLDRNQEYAVVLQENGESNVYANEEIVLSGNDKEVVGLNGSVIAEVDEDEEITTHSYSYYGVSNTKEEGHAYNGEYVQSNGLIYLRARYYNPSTGNFIQIDNNYAGEAENVATQNRYNYTLSNPYKYVDKDGNNALAQGFGHIIVQARYVIQHPWLTPERYMKPTAIWPYAQKMDLFNESTGEVWEIKPQGQEIEGQNQLNRYILAAPDALKRPIRRGGPIYIAPMSFSYADYYIDVQTQTAGYTTRLVSYEQPERKFIGKEIPTLVFEMVKDKDKVKSPNPNPVPDFLKNRYTQKEWEAYCIIINKQVEAYKNENPFYNFGKSAKPYVEGAVNAIFTPEGVFALALVGAVAAAIVNPASIPISIPILERLKPAFP